MDQFEFTKIAAAILLPLLLIFGFKTIVETRTAGVHFKPGYVLPGGEPAAAEAPAEGEKTAAAATAADAKPAEGATAPAAEGAKAESARLATPSKRASPKPSVPTYSAW